jgi:hypothetical protein
MSIQYAGGTIVNTTFTQSTGTLAEIVTNLATQLTNAGWTVASGSGGDQTLKSALTPQGSQIQVRLYDPGGANICARAQLKNVSGGATSQDIFLVPAVSKVWRVIANKYQFFCFTGSALAREWLAGGNLFSPSWLTVSNNVAWIQGNAAADGTTGAGTPSFRIGLSSANTSSNSSRQSHLVADVLVDHSGSGSSATGAQALVVPVGALPTSNGATTNYRWKDDSIILFEAMLGMGLPTTGSECKIQGLIWDAFVANAEFAADTTVTVDGHTFWCLTANNVGVTNQSNRGSLFVAVT